MAEGASKSKKQPKKSFGQKVKGFFKNVGSRLGFGRKK